MLDATRSLKPKYLGLWRLVANLQPRHERQRGSERGKGFGTSTLRVGDSVAWRFVSGSRLRVGMFPRILTVLNGLIVWGTIIFTKDC